MNADGTERRIIDPAGWSAEWSPCGDKIAYTAFLGGSGNLVVYDLTTEETTPLFTADDISFIKWGFASRGTARSTERHALQATLLALGRDDYFRR